MKHQRICLAKTERLGLSLGSLCGMATFSVLTKLPFQVTVAASRKNAQIKIGSCGHVS